MARATLERGRERGLPSLNEARAERRRALVFGRVRLQAMPPQFWLWVAVLVGGFFVVYWRIVQGQLESARGAVMSKQRAILHTLGPKILPFRDQIEGWTQTLAGEYAGNFSASDANLWDVQTSAGVYLRLRRQNALSPDKIRAAAAQSLHDGFTSCFFIRRAAPDPTQGPHCRGPADCQPGLLCNEYAVCAPPPRPYNMRLAYRALRVLSKQWSEELYDTDSELGVTAYDRDLDSVTRNDVPVAIELLQRAKYFTLVLDEDPPQGLPAALPDAGERPEERLQRVPHWARIGIWNLQSGRLLLRLRARADAKAVPVGDHVVTRTETVAAEQRQVNSCMLAMAAKGALAQAAASQKATDGGAARANPP